MKKSILFFAGILIAIPAFMQEPENNSDTLRADALNVFMQASDYLRKEIPYINYVRDIKDADVYIISTMERTGSGGYEYSYYITGQYDFAGMSDTVSFATTPDETTDGRRQKEILTLKMGLMRYVAKTPLSKYLTINFSQPMSETVATDKWKSWVFRASINGNYSEETTSKNGYLSSNITASKITKDWKMNFRFYYYYTKTKIDNKNFQYTSERDSKSFNTLIVRSINDHWSYGGSISVENNTYSNYNLNLRVLPGIEYDVFPYSQSTRRQFRFLYRAGFEYANYYDTTVYLKTSQDLWQHSLSASYEIIQKWGSIDLTLGYSNYLHDWTKNNLSLYAYMNFRILKGLSFNIQGGVEAIHNQLNIPKGTSTPEEILTRQKQQATNYSYYTYFGFSYTFGSIYNNVVNPRFGE